MLRSAVAASVFLLALAPMSGVTAPLNIASPMHTGVVDHAPLAIPVASDDTVEAPSSRIRRRGSEPDPNKQLIPEGYYRDDNPNVVRPPRGEPGVTIPAPPPDQGIRRLSCNQAKAVLQRRGFSHIRTRDCVGRYFSFQALWYGHRYVVSVRARDGRIMSLTPA